MRGKTVRLKNVTLTQFQASVDRVNSMTNDEGVAYAGNLRVHQDAHETGARVITTVGRLAVHDSKAPGARRSASGRRMPAACWHAFRDVVQDILDTVPDAVVTTSMARYDAATFADVYPATGDVSIGSMVAPAYMPELCDCEH